MLAGFFVSKPKNFLELIYQKFVTFVIITIHSQVKSFFN